jgi:LmbE family N-acetylglucosaminyl deacetylase
MREPALACSIFDASCSKLPRVLPAAAPPVARTRLHVVAVGAHPDDPESGCGGTLALYADLGHEVTLIYLTRGELGIEGQSPEETAATRTNEAELACKILGATARFAGQTNGHVEATRARLEDLRKLLEAASPDVVLAPWPVDADPEHQIASMLTVQAALALGRAAALYFYEIDSGTDTLGFVPSVYVDIARTRERKMAALRAHASQSFANLYERHDAKIEEFRGRALGVAAAEAFASLAAPRARGPMPGL